jgi:hypothetical protein
VSAPFLLNDRRHVDLGTTLPARRHSLTPAIDGLRFLRCSWFSCGPNLAAALLLSSRGGCAYSVQVVQITSYFEIVTHSPTAVTAEQGPERLASYFDNVGAIAVGAFHCALQCLVCAIAVGSESVDDFLNIKIKPLCYIVGCHIVALLFFHGLEIKW